MTWLRLIFISALALFAVTANAKDGGRYASIIVDANSLDVLHARQIDAQRHPASLTKIMTLHLVFEAIETGQMALSDDVTVSRHAAATPPVKMGLVAGQSIDIDTLIQAVAVRSSNDAAVVLAEAVAGTEAAFAERMNAKAADLGMIQTRYYNPHGLPNPDQVTTARDMAKLALATMTRFPQYYPYFGQTEFRGRRNTNRLLTARSDVDGFKTGYTRASGYNLVISAVRGEDRILAVVLGGASSHARNSHMSDLIDRGFDVIGQTPAPVLQASVTRPVGPPRWAMQIDGFTSPAEAAILADQLVRTAGIGTVGDRRRERAGQVWHSVRVEQLDQATARDLCSRHADILGIPSRRCKVLSLGDPS